MKICTQRNPKSNTKLNPNLKNRKTNVNEKTNPNLNLQKTLKKTFKSKKIIARTGFE